MRFTWLPSSAQDNLNTPLHIACLYKQISSVKILLNLSASPVLCDSQNNTPIHIAAQLGYTEILKLLLSSRQAQFFDQ